MRLGMYMHACPAASPAPFDLALNSLTRTRRLTHNHLLHRNVPDYRQNVPIQDMHHFVHEERVHVHASLTSAHGREEVYVHMQRLYRSA